MKTPNARRRLCHAIQAAITMGALSILTLPAAMAQADGDEAEDIDEIVVTGSRIRQNPLEAMTPVQIYSREDLERTGAVSIGEFLQKLAISGSAINRANNSSGNLGFPPDGTGIGAGAAEVDLRFLSSKRVLVLVDGRRWVRGSSASGVSGAVDLNTIPTNVIKSIEILQDGASAIYGSDAIGGVVNIITQDDYSGFKVTAYTGQFDEGDGESEEIDIRLGASGDRSRMFVDVSYTNQKNVSAADRDISFYPIAGFPFGVSSGTPSGRFVFTDPRTGETVSLAPNSTSPIYDPQNPTAGGFHGFALEDRFNFQVFNHLSTPNERVNIFSKAEYDITDSVTFRLLGSFNNRKSQSQAAPEPLFLGPDGGGGTYLENVFWPADHPFNPFGVDLGPDDIVFFGRRPIEAGPRIFDQNVDTWYISAGLDGQFSFGDNPVYWDTTLIWSQNKATQVKRGAFNARNISVALGPTEICDATPGCTPLNLVGAGSITQEMLDFVTFVQKDESEQELLDFTFNLTGEFTGWAAPIGYAVGFEHREENGSFTPDSRVTSGETAGVPASPTDGGFKVDEFYGEINVPIFRGDNGLKLDVSAAVRSSDYDLFGTDTVGKLGINFAPYEDLLFRVSFSEGLRAPNIGELFNTGSRFDAGLNDRCSNVTAADAANCAALGVPAGYVAFNPQTSVSTGGNSNLSPETSDTFTVGFTWNLGFLSDNVNFIESSLFEVNYYDIELKDAIQPPSAQDILDSCIDNPASSNCNSIARTPSGTITRIAGELQNIGGIETSGYDIALALRTIEFGIGQFSIQWTNTILDDYIEIDQAGVRTDRAGTELGSPERGFVKYKSNVNVDWFKGNWSAGVAFRYLDSLRETCGGSLPDFGLTNLCSNDPVSNTLDSALFTDVQVSWNPDFHDNQWTIKLGADNLFDEDIPICYTCDLNSFDGTLYPIPGTFYYARVTFEME